MKCKTPEKAASLDRQGVARDGIMPFPVEVSHPIFWPGGGSSEIEVECCKMLMNRTPILKNILYTCNLRHARSPTEVNRILQWPRQYFLTLSRTYNILRCLWSAMHVFLSLFHKLKIKHILKLLVESGPDSNPGGEIFASLKVNCFCSSWDRISSFLANS